MFYFRPLTASLKKPKSVTCYTSTAEKSDCSLQLVLVIMSPKRAKVFVNTEAEGKERQREKVRNR